MNVYDFYITPEEYERAEANGISRQLLDQRVRTLNWPHEKAITKLPHVKHPIKDWVEIAEEHGICYSTLRYRINRLHLEPEVAATKPLQDRTAQAKKAYEAGRKYPKEIIKLAKKNRINYDTFRYRVNSGMDMLEAATKPIMTPSEIGLLTKKKRQKGIQRLFVNKKRKHKLLERKICK